MKAKEASLSSNNSNENCDLSLEEGVKASNAHETILKSPQAKSKDFNLKILNST
jgi:hypothetical protein